MLLWREKYAISEDGGIMEEGEGEEEGK